MMLKNKQQIEPSQAILPIAVHVFFVNGNKILLLRRSNTGFKDGQWSVPAGRLDKGEPISLAACREAKEEVGVEVKCDSLENTFTMHHHDERGERLYFFFKASKWEGKFKNMEPEKCDKIAWFSLDNLPDVIVEHIKYALDSIGSDEFYGEYGF